MGRLTIDDTCARVAASDEVCCRLESGDILYFPTNPIPLDEADRAFLRAQKQFHTALYKNVSYRPSRDRLRGVDAKDAIARERAHRIMREHSRKAVAFMAQFLPRYARDWKIDLASFRPIEEQGRKAALRSRNDLIHIDSFPSRPSHGDRLLRIFTNIHPNRPRVWVTSESFEQLALKYAGEVGLPDRPTAMARLQSQARQLLAAVGVPGADRSLYDRFMLRLHNFLKESDRFQRDCPKDRWEFGPDTSWICFTDTTSHSCVSGQYALEQTFIVRRGSLVLPEKAPIAILERLAGFPLVGDDRARSA